MRNLPTDPTLAAQINDHCFLCVSGELTVVETNFEDAEHRLLINFELSFSTFLWEVLYPAVTLSGTTVMLSSDKYIEKILLHPFPVPLTDMFRYPTWC